jgi:hypothetical protein
LLRIANTDLISRASESLEEVYDEDEGGINEENNEYGWGSV